MHCERTQTLRAYACQCSTPLDSHTRAHPPTHAHTSPLLFTVVPKGSYWDFTEEAVQLCPVDTYSDTERPIAQASTCTDCPPNTASPVGSISQDQCVFVFCPEDIVVTTDQAAYVVGDDVIITATVLDCNGNPVVGEVGWGRGEVCVCEGLDQAASTATACCLPHTNQSLLCPCLLFHATDRHFHRPGHPGHLVRPAAACSVQHSVVAQHGAQHCWALQHVARLFNYSALQRQRVAHIPDHCSALQLMPRPATATSLTHPLAAETRDDHPAAPPWSPPPTLWAWPPSPAPLRAPPPA